MPLTSRGHLLWNVFPSKMNYNELTSAYIFFGESNLELFIICCYLVANALIWIIYALLSIKYVPDVELDVALNIPRNLWDNLKAAMFFLFVVYHAHIRNLPYIPGYWIHVPAKAANPFFSVLSLWSTDHSWFIRDQYVWSCLLYSDLSRIGVRNSKRAATETWTRWGKHWFENQSLLHVLIYICNLHCIEHGDKRAKAQALKKIMTMVLNGDRLPGLLMTIIRFVLPSQDHTLKKLLLIFWEIWPKTSPDGKLLHEMILVCDAYRKVLWSSMIGTWMGEMDIRLYVYGGGG